AMIEKIKAAAHAKVNASVAAPAKTSTRLAKLDTSTLVVIGASTGGTEALRQLLTALPAGIPPILVVQHIPEVFSTAFARRLKELCAFDVREAVDGEVIEAGRVLVAPGGRQLEIVRRGKTLRARVTDGPLVNRHKPSVDVLFDSVAKHCGAGAVGVILTGMGSDGAEGLLKMKNAGARTIAQSEASCVVFGMPRAAVEAGAVDKSCDLADIPMLLLRWLAAKKAA
ncbi:MAG: chemotaxis protein CheB, partial [Deltaproteobacteria bacterium]|nr:chemotaxis protein CheB [Deltaproteobacteria bacterium]